MRARKYKLLRSLTIAQLSAVLLGVLGLGLSYFWITRDTFRQALKKERAKVILSVNEQQEKWRTWKQLGLDETLQKELGSHQKVFSLSDLRVVPVSELKVPISTEEAVIPDFAHLPSDALVVYARLDPHYIESVYVPYRSNLLLLSLSGVLFCFVILFSSRFIRKHIYVPFLELRRVFEQCNAGKDVHSETIAASGEIREFILSLVELYKKLKENEKSAAMVAVARQVAHDIRSPLAALDMILDSLPQMPEQKRLIIRGALNRIRDIANNVLERSKRSLALDSAVESANLNAQGDLGTFSAHSVASLIDEIVTEKQVLLRPRPQVKLESEITESAHGLFALVQPQGFKTALSNLINNAVEAIGEAGVVRLEIAQDGDRVRVEVKDNGCGMSAATLKALQESGGTFGKAQGHGLGLSHARSSVSRWNGTLKIESSEGVGTTVSIELPLVSPPKWFVPVVEVAQGTTVLILDDDPSIHLVWEQRFAEAITRSGAPVFVEHFSDTASLRHWCTQNQRLMSTLLFLCDYEIMGASENGIELIRSLYLTERSILVTGRFDEEQVRQDCDRYGIRLLPKSLGGWVPVKIKRLQGVLDAVLVDDDPLVHMSWELSAKEAQKSYRGFYSVREFLQAADSLDRETPVYVDRNLGPDEGEEKGDDAARHIARAGFEKVFIATGEGDAPASRPWVRGVKGKTPPWHTMH